MIGARYHMSALPYIEMSIPDELIRTVNVSYFVDTLLEAKHKNAKKTPNPLLEATLDPRAFEPKTWYASSFGVNDNGQTVLIGPYDEDELIQEAERRGAVKILREMHAHLLRESARIHKDLLTEEWTDGWKVSVGFNVTFATIDTILSTLRAHEYDEREETESFLKAVYCKRKDLR